MTDDALTPRTAPLTPTEPAEHAVPPEVPTRGSSLSRGAQAGRLQGFGLLLASLIVPLPFAVNRVIAAVYFFSNPQHLDVHKTGAYLGPVLGWSFAVFGVLVLLTIIIFVIIYRRARTLDSLRLPLLIVVLEVILGIIAVIFTFIAQ